MPERQSLPSRQGAPGSPTQVRVYGSQVWSARHVTRPQISPHWPVVTSQASPAAQSLSSAHSAPTSPAGRQRLPRPVGLGRQVLSPQQSSLLRQVSLVSL